MNDSEARDWPGLPDMILVDRTDLHFAGAALHFAAERVGEFRAYVLQWHPEDAAEPAAAYLQLLRRAHAHLTPDCADTLGPS